MRWILHTAVILFMSLALHEMPAAQSIFAGVQGTDHAVGDYIVRYCITPIDKGAQVRYIHPTLDESESIDLLVVDAMRIVQGAGQDSAIQTYQVMALDTGQVTLPPCQATMMFADGRTMTVTSESTIIDVRPPAGASLQPEPIKDIIRTSWRLTAVWYWVLAVFALLLCAYIYHVRKRSKTKDEPQAAIIQVTPYEHAMSRLSSLELQSSSTEDIKQHYAACSHILREFIERTTAVPALERTTHEIMMGLRGGDSYSELQRWLMTIDQVKYADQRVSLVEADEAVDRTRRLLIDLHHRSNLEEE